MFSLFSAFIAGILTFLSPCILPLIPGYLSFITGLSLEDLKTKHSQTIVNTLFFCSGFSIIFIILGASATFLGKFFLNNLFFFSRVGGVLIITFGLQISGFFNISLFNIEKRFHLKKIKANSWTSFIMGVLFGFGWSPCIGPILGSILVLASNQKTIYQGILLLAVYSLGISIPFIITALALNKFLSLFNKIKKYFHFIEIIAGCLLIIMGILMFTGQLEKINLLFGR